MLQRRGQRSRDGGWASFGSTKQARPLARPIRDIVTGSAIPPLLALALTLGGCEVGPDFKSADAPVSDKWLEANNPSVKTDRQEYEQWWTVYNDPTLNQLIDKAYRQNLSLQAAGARVLEARAILGISIGQFYPQVQQVNVSAAYAQASKTDTSSNPGSFLDNYWKATMGLQVAWEIDLWGKFRRSTESASASYLASIATYDDALVTLLSDVATTYIGIRTLQTQIEIAKENVVKQQRALIIARDRYRGGVATELDVYQAENVLGQTQSTIPQLTAQLQKGEDALRVLLGMPPQSVDALIAGPQTIPVPPQDVAVGIPADLVRRRPDIRSAELKAAAQSAKIGMTKAQLFPAFTLSGVFGTTAGGSTENPLDQVFSSRSIFFAFGPSFSWPVLNYGQITNKVRVQDARLQALLLEYQDTVLKAQKEVEDGLSGFLQGRQQVELLKGSVSAATKAMNIAMDQYTLGTRDFTTVLTAAQNLYQAQSNLASASGNVSASLATLYRSLGGGWQIRGNSEFVNDKVRAEMRNRTDWGSVLPPAGPPPQPEPGLPGPDNVGPNVQAPKW
ncbi:efflux transporter, outer membrane factor (OMF) lipoprotein, NodT family [Enhydrobacter aerosaccus]|uniref:Efflux transporter, outer membrane factor (OMF) lipoprotein, NodT family n=1 Tax=Enhydrobacter aerosaccus TaxID=225324 RepID=A0A1T4NK06_9HYPH|nr:efflux transporter outer membrane subunit [Enhydrobacter aerosaccus]SJZ79078.1 efflux transporter, outer membrane factor (OMF) lipoprotein, NodT family [Enhydrobacter aerosaccus]